MNFSDDNNRNSLTAYVKRLIVRLTSTRALNIFQRSHKTLNRELVQDEHGNGIPSVAQIRALPRVLHRTERIIAFIALIALVGSVGTLITMRIIGHVHTVPAIGGEYSEVLVGNPHFINPLLAPLNPVDEELSRLIYTGLYRRDEHLVPQPDLAESLTVSADGKTYTVVLKRDRQWQDGKPVTADDALFTYTSIQDPNWRSPLYALWKDISIEKIDDLTIRLNLPAVRRDATELLTVGLLPEHIWGAIAPQTATLADYNLRPIGAGPYGIDSRVLDKADGSITSYTLKRNPYNESAYIDKLTFYFAHDGNELKQLLESKSARGALVLSSGNLPRAIDTYHVIDVPLLQYTALFYNPKHNTALADSALRSALDGAIDRTQLLSDANVRGVATTLAHLPETPNTPNSPASENTLSTLLNKAGWSTTSAESYWDVRADVIEQELKAANPELSAEDRSAKTQLQLNDERATTPQGNVLKDAKGNFLRLTIVTTELDEFNRVAQAVATDWRTMGVLVDIQKVPMDDFLKSVVKPRAYDVLLFGQRLGSDHDLYPFWHSSQTADSGLALSIFTDKSLDKALEAGQVATDSASALAAVAKAAQIINDNYYASILYEPIAQYLTDGHIQGMILGTLSTPADRFNTVGSWYLKTRKSWSWE